MYKITLNKLKTLIAASLMVVTLASPVASAMTFIPDVTISNVHAEQNGTTVTSFDPTRNSVRVCFNLSASTNATVRVDIYGNGNTVNLLDNMVLSPTSSMYCSDPWNGKNSGTYVSNGIYTLRVAATVSRYYSTYNDTKESYLTVSYNNNPNPGDTTAPVLSNPSSIGSTYSTNPSFSFDSNEAGSIVYGGNCSNGQTNTAYYGRNTITYNQLAYGTFSNCTVSVRDAAGNLSSALYVPTFTVLQNDPPIVGAPPVVSNYYVSKSPFDPDDEYTLIYYSIDRDATVTVEILDGSYTVKTLVNRVSRSTGTRSEVWDGRNSGGSIVSDSSYTYRITASNVNGSDVRSGSVRVDRYGYNDNNDDYNTSDLLGSIDLDDSTFDPTDNERAKLNFDVRQNDTYITVEVMDGSTVLKSLLDNIRYNSGTNFTTYWNGRDRYNDIVDNGSYEIRVRANRNGYTDSDDVTVYVDDNYSGNNNYYDNNSGDYGDLIRNISVRNNTFNPDGSEYSYLNFDVIRDNTNVTVEVMDGNTVVRTLANGVNYDSDSDKTVSWNGRDKYGDIVDDDVYGYRITAEKNGYSDEEAYVEVEVDTDGRIIGLSDDNYNSESDDCGGYWDVQPNSSYCKAIALMNMKGVFKGYSDGSFRPTQSINRAEAAKVILLALGYTITTQDNSNLGYRDVDRNAWYMPYLRTAQKNGIMSGYSDGTMRPEQTVTRVELLKIFLKASGVSVPYCSSAPYSDTPNTSATSWYLPYVCYASDNGLMSLTGGGYFNPQAPMTRGDVAELFYQFESRGLKDDVSTYAYDNPSSRHYYYDRTNSRYYYFDSKGRKIYVNSSVVD